MADPLPDPDSAPAATAPAPATPSAAGSAAAVATPPSSAAPRVESRTTRLYRAALGPVNTARYLQVFERFDAVGRRLLVWNPAAGLFTLGWLVFRRLWKEALVYAVLAAGAIGLSLWAWPLMQSWPPGVRWGLLGALGLVGVLLPGLLGDGWVHRQVQRRLLRAVTAAQSMDEARAALARQAATPARLWTLVAAHAAVLGAVWLVWLVWGQGLWPAAARQHLAAPARAVSPAPAAPALSPPVPAASVVLPSTPALSAATRQPLGGDAGAVPVPTRVPPQAPVQSPVVVPDPPVRARPVAADQAPALVLPATPQTPAVAPAPASTAWQSTSAEPAGVPAVAPPTATPLVPARPPAAPAAAYAINVGLFADAGNARRAQARLQQAGLPVVVQAITTAQGPRTRVRVGPYPQRARADEAAARIRTLGLEAVVFPLASRP